MVDLLWPYRTRCSPSSMPSTPATSEVQTLFDHIIQHKSTKQGPSVKCVLCITAVYAIFPIAAGLRLPDSVGMTGPDCSMRAASPSPSLQQGNAAASPHISLLGSSPPVGHASGPASHLDATQGLGAITGLGPDSQAFDLAQNGRGDFDYSIVDRPSAQRGSPKHRCLGRVQSQRRSSSLSEYYPRTSMPSPPLGDVPSPLSPSSFWRRALPWSS